MNIEEINKRHYFKTDLYYRTDFGLSSKLLAVKNGIAYLRVIINNRWKKDYKTTALEIAHCWKQENPELEEVFGCKVFIVDAKENPYKFEMIKMGLTVEYDISLGLLFGEELLN